MRLRVGHWEMKVGYQRGLYRSYVFGGFGLGHFEDFSVPSIMRYQMYKYPSERPCGSGQPSARAHVHPPSPFRGVPCPLPFESWRLGFKSSLSRVDADFHRLDVSLIAFPACLWFELKIMSRS